MRIGVVGIRGGNSSEELADAVAEVTGSRLLIDAGEMRLDLDAGKCLWQGEDLCGLDAVLVKKLGTPYSPDMLNRLEILRFLETRGVKVLAKPATMARLINRMSCTVDLRAAGIPMPPTTITESVDEAYDAVRAYGTAVLKPLYTSKARGMELVTFSKEETYGVLARYKQHFPTLYIQKAVDLADGMDLGVVFLGDSYLATYARKKGEGAWNTTTASGGHYMAYTPDSSIITLADKARGVFNLPFTCVDVALTGSGAFVFEVSAFGGFKGIAATSGLRPARLLVRHALTLIN